MAAPGGVTMVEWTRRLTGETPLVVCRSHQAEALDMTASFVACDTGGGPVRALKAALPHVTGAVTVLFADTWAAELPEGEFCGVAAAVGGRSWDVVEDGLVAYRHVDLDECALVAVGAYRFHDIPRLRVAVGHSLRLDPPDCSMGEVVNRYGVPFRPVNTWQDIGDYDSFRSFRDPHQ
jgi:hypothetical protein